MPGLFLCLFICFCVFMFCGYSLSRSCIYSQVDFFFFGGEGSTTSLFCILRPFVDFLIFARFMYLLFARACMNYLPTWFCIYSLSDFLVSTPCRIFFFLLYFFICLTRVCCICSQILHLLLARVSHRSPPCQALSISSLSDRVFTPRATF